MTIRKEVLDEFIKDYQNPEDLPDENGLLKQLIKTRLERAMKAELTHELGFAKNDKSSLKETGNWCGWTPPRRRSSRNTGKLNQQCRVTGQPSLSRRSSKSINAALKSLTI